MERGTQQAIATKAKISQTFISLIMSGKRRPSWHNAKALAIATNTNPELWLDGTPEQIKQVLDSVNF